MSQLRPHLQQADFVEQVRYQMKEGYELAFLQKEEQTLAVAGFRISNCLALGKFLYIDDLVVDELKRSLFYGQQLFQWLIEYAQNHQCQHLSLDSGVQRFEAHRFYLMQRIPYYESSLFDKIIVTIDELGGLLNKYCFVRKKVIMSSRRSLALIKKSEKLVKLTT